MRAGKVLTKMYEANVGISRKRGNPVGTNREAFRTIGICQNNCLRLNCFLFDLRVNSTPPVKHSKSSLAKVVSLKIWFKWILAFSLWNVKMKLNSLKKQIDADSVSCILLSNGET
jgi:hypothetical protein